MHLKRGNAYSAFKNRSVECRDSEKNMSQFTLTRITHQVLRAFDLNIFGNEKGEKPMKMFWVIMLSLFLGASGNQQLTNSVEMARISKTLDLALAQGNLIENVDTHSGSHGDGDSLQTWTFADDSLLKQIQADSAWKPFPLTKNLEALLYGVTYDEGLSVTVVGPYVSFSEEQLPRVEHGYYYFVDRQAESEQQNSDEQILERVSYNFSIAIYDTDTDTLYYVEADS